MDELIRSHAPKRERDFDAAPPAKQRATTNDLSLDRTLDELFAEGGALAGQLRPRKEEDARRLAQRAKQVEFGKNTNGYENYVRAVPKRERKGYQEHPRTPDITQEASKRKFDGIVQAWRRKLHEWDEPAPTATAPAAAADGADAAAAAADADDAFDDYLESALGQFGSTGTLPSPARAAAPAPRRSPRAVAAAAAAPPPPAASPTAPPREPTMRERLDAMKQQPPTAAAAPPPAAAAAAVDDIYGDFD